MSKRHALGCLAFTAIALQACGGPNYGFDPAPAPPWVEEIETRKGSVWSVTGATAVSLDKKRDVSLATEDAKSRLALMLSSQVKSQSRDTSWSAAQSGERAEGQLIEQQIVIDSEVRIEGAEVTAAYREEATHRQLVKVSVDVSLWRKRISDRLEQRLVLAEGQLQLVKAMVTTKATQALAKFAGLQNAGAQMDADVKLLTLLGDERGLAKRYEQWTQTWRDMGEAIHKEVTVHVSGHEEVVREATRFMQELGVKSVAEAKDAAIVIVGTVQSRFVREESAGKRKEQIYGCRASILVSDRSGSVPEWSVDQAELTVGDIKAESAKQKAEIQSVNSVGAKLRSRVRSALVAPN